MAKIITKGKRKRFISLAALTLSATLSLGIFAACGGAETTEGGDDETEPSTPTDTQIIKNGNFEFFSEMTKEKLSDYRNLISEPTSWTLTTVSPSSDTKSGIVNTKKEEWDYLTKPGTGTFTSIDDAYANWNADGVTAYDRLKFLDLTTKLESVGGFKEAYDALPENSEQRTFFQSYKSGGSDQYTIDYEDVSWEGSSLAEDFPDGITLHKGAKEGDTHVLMLHTFERSDGVLGTATYATSSTTITLKGGTAAKVSLWVRTDKLYHYYESDKTEVKEDGGAYISVVNSVGSNSNGGDFIIKNINTNGEWEQYTVYIRANTYATTTYRIRVGLGRNTSSDNRLEAVNGYAFFDDVVGETISEADYIKATTGGETPLPDEVTSDLKSSETERIKDATALAAMKKSGSLPQYDRTFAFDLLDAEEFNPVDDILTKTEVTMTEETSGSLTVTSKVLGNRPEDNSGVTETADKRSIAEATTYASLKTRATDAADAGYNGFLKNYFNDDFEGKFPFYQGDGTTVDENTPVIMLLSTNGAAYTAKLTSEKFSLGKDEYMLISFFVKTSKIRSGKTGASVSLIDGENKTTISAFDSTTVATVDIDKDRKDIYMGWVQCFFIVKNETNADKTFSLEFYYGPTSIVGSKVSDYADGYAAFTGFEYVPLNKAQANYASTGSYAKSVSLTASAADSTKFDDAAASYDIEKELSKPATFGGVSADLGADATKAIATGLLNAQYKDNYYTPAEQDDKLDALKTMPLANGATTAEEWWNALFGDEKHTARVATQPLVIYNPGTEPAPSYGYTLRSYENTISANTTQSISMRIKVAEGTKAYIYLTDLSDVQNKGFNTYLTPTLPSVTYWYDDNGNIVKGDPTAEEFNRNTDILYYLESNGLYTKAGATGTPVYYANLHNYKVDEETGDYLLKSGKIAYYCNPADKKIYAYRSGNEGSYVYEQEVLNLPTADEDGNSITRYAVDRDTSAYTSVIEVDGSKIASNTWVDVAFYIRTGSEAKNYLVEIWAGAKKDASGLPAKGYVFVDNYKSASSSNFEAIRSERVDMLAEDEANRTDADDENSNLIPSLALYNTFTFYDSDAYLRYDKSQNTEGNPWIDYKQSDYEEGIAWLRYDTIGTDSDSLVSEMFFDYTVSEVTVTAHEYDTDDTTDTEDTSDSEDSGTNVWLIISSAVLAVVLIFAIVAVIVRRLYKRHNRGKIKLVKEKPAKKQKAPKKQKEEAPKPEETEPDENDPYNE